MYVGTNRIMENWIWFLIETSYLLQIRDRSLFLLVKEKIKQDKVNKTNVCV